MTSTDSIPFAFAKEPKSHSFDDACSIIKEMIKENGMPTDDKTFWPIFRKSVVCTSSFGSPWRGVIIKGTDQYIKSLKNNSENNNG